MVLRTFRTSGPASPVTALASVTASQPSRQAKGEQRRLRLVQPNSKPRLEKPLFLIEQLIPHQREFEAVVGPCRFG